MFRFHPSLGIPLITTGASPLVNLIVGFLFPSLFRDSSDHHVPSATPVPTVTKTPFPSLFRDSSDHHLSTVAVVAVHRGQFPSLFRDSSDHHPLQSLRQKKFHSTEFKL